MNGERRQVLQLLADGQVTTDEAERLLATLEGGETALALQEPDARPARYLRVQVDTLDEGGPLNVNLRVPIQLLRAGVKLVGVIPPQAQEYINRALRDQGLPFDLTQIKPENLDEIIDQLCHLSVDVDRAAHGGGEAVKARIFCE
jgi:hypothetical protein